MTYSKPRPVGAKLALSLVLLASAAAFANACGSDGGDDGVVPFVPDSGVAPMFDATIPPFVPPVVPPDATVVPDATPIGDGALPTDASDDAGATDAGDTDAGTDAGEPDDAGADAGMDASTDAGTDAGMDASTDAGSDASTDAGSDASVDAGSDASVDASTDAGTYPYVRGADPTTQTASQAGPYTVSNYTSGFATTANFSAGTIYYPTNATAPFALAVIVPDSLSQDRADVAGWGSFFASHGIVTMTIDLPNVLANGAARATALTDALAALRAENTRTGSALRGKVDTTHAAVLGVGAGAQGALIAASSNPSLSAVVALSLSNNQTFTSLAVPALFITGETGVFSAGVSQTVYAALPGTASKLVLELNNQGPDVSLDPANQSGVVGRFGLSWLKTYLEGDTRYRPFLLARPTQASAYTTTLR